MRVSASLYAHTVAPEQCAHTLCAVDCLETLGISLMTNATAKATKRPSGKPPTAMATEPAAEWVAIADLVPWAKNPRKNDAAVPKVKASIKRFGFGAPLLARKADGEIIAGHTRLKAAIELGLTTVPVRYLDLDPAEAHLLALADNRVGEEAEWDEDLLAQVLLDVSDTDRLATGFDDAEIQQYLADLTKTELGGEDVTAEPPKDPITKPGDVWVLGEHRLLCGDCRNPADVSRLLGNGRVNVAFTSPPYASQRKYDETSGFKPISPDEYVAWFDAVQANVRAHLADDGSWFVNIKEHCDEGQRSLYVKDLTIAHVRQWGWALIDELCWRNTLNGVPGGYVNRLKNAWEPVFHFTKDLKPKFRPTQILHESEGAFGYSKANGKSGSGSGIGLGDHDSGTGMARPSNVLEIAGETSRGEHTAPFPVALPTFFIKAFSDPGDVIFDPFMGSGTTIVACEQTGRRGFGTEISPGYCDVIVQRWERLTGKKATQEAA